MYIWSVRSSCGWRFDLSRGMIENPNPHFNHYYGLQEFQACSQTMLCSEHPAKFFSRFTVLINFPKLP